MGIELFQHNKTAYEAAVKLMAEEGKAAIIHPTGTGKSYIAFKLVEENPWKRFLWLAPSEYIFRTQWENLQGSLAENEDKMLSNVTFAEKIEAQDTDLELEIIDLSGGGAEDSEKGSEETDTECEFEEV